MRAKVEKKYRELARSMIERDKRLKVTQNRYEKMSRLVYSLPENLADLDWVQPVISTTPNDALRGVTRALSNLDEDLSIDPVTVMKVTGDDENLQAKVMSNLWEKVLGWELGRSSRRRRSLRADVIWSAAVQDEVVAQLIHLPTQFKISKPEWARRQAAMRFGDWAIKIVDPQSVYVTYSEYMPERVLCITARTVRELIEEWGEDRLKELVKKMKDDEEYADQPVIEYDMVDHVDGRKVWYAEGNGVDAEVDGNYILKPEPWLKIAVGDNQGEQVPFLNWICVAGGTTIDTAPEFQRKPLLFSVMQSGLWETTNILKTIVMSKAIATAAAPEHIVFGPGMDDFAVDYTVPGGVMSFPTRSLHDYQKAPDGRLDPALTEGVDRSEAEMARASVAEVLITAKPISGEQAFASYNLQVQQALASIGNIKELGERFYEQLYENMLLIAHYRGEDIESYVGGEDKYVISSEDIVPENIQLHVELKTDVPMDRLARINAASQLAGSGIPYPFAEILKSLGITDAEGMMRQYKREQMEMADHAGVVQMIQMERSGEIEQMARQMAEQMVQQQVSQLREVGRQAMQAPEEQGPMGEMANPAGPMAGGVPGVGGPGMAPPMGGLPPAMASPEGATREARQAVEGFGPIGRV